MPRLTLYEKVKNTVAKYISKQHCYDWRRALSLSCNKNVPTHGATLDHANSTIILYFSLKGNRGLFLGDGESFVC